MRMDVTITGVPEARAQLDRVGAALSGQMLLRATMAGALVVQNAAKRRAPVRTGTLRRSIHTEPGKVSARSAEAVVGTDVPYARRIEYGFTGADRLGRVYDQPPRPYLRPAVDESRTQVGRVIAGALRAQILRAAR